MPEIIVNFAYRSYIFYSNADITKARSIYVKCLSLDLNDFENDLDKASIDYCYELNMGLDEI